MSASSIFIGDQTQIQHLNRPRPIQNLCLKLTNSNTLIKMKLSSVFKLLEECKDDLDISNYSVSQPTLEQVRLSSLIDIKLTLICIMYELIIFGGIPVCNSRLHLFTLTKISVSHPQVFIDIARKSEQDDNRELVW